jgi:hypothetical protein
MALDLGGEIEEHPTPNRQVCQDLSRIYRGCCALQRHLWIPCLLVWKHNAPPMALSPGTKPEPNEIVSAAGAGGMGRDLPRSRYAPGSHRRYQSSASASEFKRRTQTALSNARPGLSPPCSIRLSACCTMLVPITKRQCTFLVIGRSGIENGLSPLIATTVKATCAVERKACRPSGSQCRHSCRSFQTRSL